ncbi:MAG TPA: hypothetical protein VI816_02415 [Candidatus Bathyarchaeia archaeon]|nr:hypothetical protein [Candidatus Bathyarchaeia archaeon]
MGSTGLVSGAVSDTSSNDNAYMVFRSYATGSSSTLYVHNENRTIAGTSYRTLSINPADLSGAMATSPTQAPPQPTRTKLERRQLQPDP